MTMDAIYGNPIIFIAACYIGYWIICGLSRANEIIGRMK
jgi:hypothetical protein